MLHITEIRIDGLTQDIVTDAPHPAFSIKAESDKQNDTAVSHQIIVTCGEKTVWNSRLCEGENLLYIPYNGEPLQPETEYHVTATVTNTAGETAQAETTFRTGLLGRAWQAQWITHPTFTFGKKENPPALVFQKRFTPKKEIASAYIYATALGVYTLQLDDAPVGHDVLAPGYTSYKNQMQYQVYPVAAQLTPGKETLLEATVAGGWAVATFGPFGSGQHFGKKQALLLELHIRYADGTAEVIATDSSWNVTANGPIREASIYDGEIVDARIDTRSSTAQAAFVPAAILPQSPTKELTATYGSLPQRIQTLTPVSETQGKNGIIFDFGQNFAGAVRLTLNGKMGQKITVRHAEVLMDGELFTQPLRTAKAKIEYTCRDGQQTYTPQYTYMGFRYVEVQGIPRADFEITADVISSVTEVTGTFSCSDPDVTQLQHNIHWGGLSNFVDIPTDCPQRDERLGWTGDIAVFASTACFNFEMSRFLKKWLKDMRSEQGKHGGIPFVIPNEMFVRIVSAGWGDSCVMVPWALYRDTGDVSILQDNYEMVQRYLAQVEKMAHRFSTGDKKYIWDYGFSFGDWLTYNETQSQWMKKRPWVSTAYYANSCGIAAQMAAALGKDADRQRYTALRRHIIDAYRKYFTDGSGTIRNGFQTAYVCPLYFDMVEGKEKAQYARNLVKLVEAADNHLTTGFLGTPYLLFALSDAGYADKAYEVLMQDTCPSWLYEVKAGATTIWERWDALRPDGTVNLGEGNVKDISEQDSNLGGGMVSFNHYANGAVGDWLYRRMAGIEATEAGYKTVQIRPVPNPKITWVKCSKETPHGLLAVEWHIEGDAFRMDVTVPFGVTADVITPTASAAGQEVGVITMKHRLVKWIQHHNFPAENSFSPKAPSQETVFGDGVRINDIAYGTQYPNSFLDIYRSNVQGTRHPLIFYVHGGGFTWGSKEDGDPNAGKQTNGDKDWFFKRFLAAGYDIVSIDYAFAPEYAYPTPILQAQQAMQFLLQNATHYGIDTTEIILCGSSAGGHIVGQYALTQTNAAYGQALGVPPILAAGQIKCILFNSALIDPTRYDVVHDAAFDYLLRKCGQAYFGDRVMKTSQGAQQANILPHLTAQYPPSFISDGNTGSFYDQAQDLYHALKRLSVPAELNITPKSEARLGHGYESFQNQYGCANMEKMLQFLQRFVRTDENAE